MTYTLEEVLAAHFDFDVDPNRTRNGVRIERAETVDRLSENHREPPARSFPERPNRSGPDD